MNQSFEEWQQTLGHLSLSTKEFQLLSDFIYTACGIKMPIVKKSMLEARLQKRLRSLGIPSFQEYCHYLFHGEGKTKEIQFFIDKITTNKTDFFREPGHFDQLTQIILPEILNNSNNFSKKLTIWSAGCSTGEEPYTLAMILSEYVQQFPAQRIQFSILATDISMEVLQVAQRAVYPEERIEPVELPLRKKYLLKHKDKNKKLIRIAPEIRKMVQFQQLNFMNENLGVNNVNIIFCRNVIIYFDKPTQEKLLNKFCQCLGPHGYLFLGHSETIQGLNVPLRQLFPTVYRKT
ncbi:MAG: chemotaxis protein CheR [SAR324 cluster bacterium]|nr:chemotaxis protein CheR [SAR324 cluster bacterium]